MKKAISIYEAIDKFKWPKPGSKVNGIEILLGEGCNAKCLFCCADRQLSKWIKFSNVKKLLDSAKEKGAWLVSFSGGEAVLYPEIFKALNYARQKNFRLIQILSNGIKLADFDFAKKIVSAGANEFKISLHSISEEKHDYLLGIKGAFSKVLKSFENLNELGVKISSNFAINSLNYKEIPLFAKFMNEEYGITGFCFMFSFYTGRMPVSNLSVRYSKVIPYLRYALEYIRQNKIPIETKMLNNFLPCLMPEYVNIMADWGEDLKYSPVAKKGKISTNREFYSGRKKFLEGCKECIYYERCFGIDAEYLSRFGGNEFIPVKKEKVYRLPDPLYI